MDDMMRTQTDENAEYNENIQEIYKNAIQDPSLMSSLDIDKLLEDLESDKNSYLENKTMEMINKEVYDAVSEVISDTEMREIICKRLIGYRYVPNICDLHTGKFVKTISRKTLKQTLCGIVANVKFTDNGTKILLVIPPSKYCPYMFDNYITFQKLSDIEQLILMAYSMHM